MCVRARHARIAAFVCACVWLCAAVLRAHFERTCSAAGEDGIATTPDNNDAAAGSAAAANGACDTMTAAGLARAGFVVAAKVIVPGIVFQKANWI